MWTLSERYFWFSTYPVADIRSSYRPRIVESLFPAPDAAYLGIEFPVEDVKAKIFDEGTAEP